MEENQVPDGNESTPPRPSAKNEDSFYSRFWRFSFSPVGASAPSLQAQTGASHPPAALDDSALTEKGEKEHFDRPVRRTLSYGDVSEAEEEDTRIEDEYEKELDAVDNNGERERMAPDRSRPKSSDHFDRLGHSQLRASSPDPSMDVEFISGQNTSVGVSAARKSSLNSSAQAQPKKAPPLIPNPTKPSIITCKNEKDVKGGIQLLVQTLHATGEDINLVLNGDTVYDKTLLATISKAVHEATINNLQTRAPYILPSFSKHQPSVPQSISWEKAATPMITKLSMAAAPPFDYYLNTFPEEVFLLRTLHELHMQRHDISTVPSNLGQLRALKTLQLPHNNIKYLPAELKHLSLLEVVDLSHNSIYNMPDGLSTLTMLKILKLSHNQLMTLPRDLFIPTSLQLLDCSYNKLSRIPDNLGDNLMLLRELDLSHNQLSLPFTSKKNEMLPGFQLPCLQRLLLNNNKLTTLPNVKELDALKEMDISNNLLTCLPGGIGNLDSLIKLKAQHNSLITLPHDLGGLKQVTELDLSYNQLDCALPESIKELGRLKMLALSYNQLSDATGLAVLGESVPLRSSLEFLDLSYNKLTTLPAELSLLDSLETLDCSNNSITELPKTMFYDPPSESSGEEKEEEDPDPATQRGFFSSLKLWDLSTNQLHSLPSEISVLPRIRYFNLSDNKLISLPSTLAQLTSLKKLQLHSKNLLVVSGSFPTSLKELSLAHISINDHTKEVEVLPQTGRDYSIEFQLQLLLSLARAAPHPLTLFALAYFAERDEFKAAMVSQGELQDFLVFAKSDYPRNRLEAIRALANFLEHDEIQRKFWRERPEGVEILLQLAQEVSEDVATRVEAIRCIANFGFDGDIRRAFMEKYGLDIFIRMLEKEDSTLIKGEINRLMNIYGAHDYLHYGPTHQRENGIRILALDGGGARAFVTLEMISKIEQVTGCKIYELFDVICGTSTGSVLASMLAYQKYTAFDCELVYRGFADAVFFGTALKSLKKTTEAAAANLASESATSTNNKPPQDAPPGPSSTTTTTTTTTTTSTTTATASSAATSSYAGWYRFVNYVQFFKSGAYYRSGPLERVLRQCCGFGNSIDLTRDDDICKTKVFVVSTEISNIPGDIYLWRNYNYPPNSKSRYKGTCRSRAWRACRASTAAPSYFDEYKPPEEPNERHIDGAAVCNNPTAVGIHEAKALWPDRPIDCVVSLGTGRFPPKPCAKGMQGLISVILSSAVSSEPIHGVLEDLLPSSTYFRFDPLDESVACALDEHREEKWAEMQQAARKYVAENESRFDELGALLLRGNPQLADKDRLRRRRLKQKRKAEREQQMQMEKETEKIKETIDEREDEQSNEQDDNGEEKTNDSTVPIEGDHNMESSKNIHL